LENKIKHRPAHEYSRKELADILDHLDAELHPEFYEEVKTEFFWRSKENEGPGTVRYEDIPELGISRFFKKLFSKKKKP